MYKEILRGIGGIDVYPVLSLIIFVTFFAAAVVRALRMDAPSVERLAALPLDGGDAVTVDAIGSGPAIGRSGVTR
jgi:cytochrome c oxidase cbb3-type subunit IV